MNDRELNQRLANIEEKLTGSSRDQQFFQLSQQINSSGDEIELAELFRTFWAGKWIILVVTLFFSLTSILYAISLPNIYKSEALLAPAEENAGGGLAKVAGQFGGLAGLAGINIGGGGSDKTALAIEVLQSREFINKFISNRQLLVPLMAARGWDLSSNLLILDEQIYDEETQNWIREVTLPRSKVPSAQEAYEMFSELLSVSQDKTTGFVRVAIEHYSPYVSKNWVDWLIVDINDEIRNRDVKEARKSIQFLQSQLEKISIAEMQSIFYELIEEQTKTIMFAEVRDEYVFKTIDPAVVPERKAKPKKALIVILGTFLGAALSIFLVLVLSLIIRNKNNGNNSLSE